jgi:hypothetical protein
MKNFNLISLGSNKQQKQHKKQPADTEDWDSCSLSSSKRFIYQKAQRLKLFCSDDLHVRNLNVAK